jgi:hypothetical protein
LWLRTTNAVAKKLKPIVGSKRQRERNDFGRNPARRRLVILATPVSLNSEASRTRSRGARQEEGVGFACRARSEGPTDPTAPPDLSSSLRIWHAAYDRRVTNSATQAIEADLAALKSFAGGYRAYWGMRADGGKRDPVKDRVALRHRLHRQLPRIEQVMVRAGTNGFGFGPPPIARGAPPRLGIVAVAFADEDPVYSAGGGPPCFEEVLNRLEMTLGVLESELEETSNSTGAAHVTRPPSASAPERVPQRKVMGGESTSEQPASVELMETSSPGGSSARVFAHGVRRAWAEARAARGSSSLRTKIETIAAIATIVGTAAGLGALLGWWGG